MYIGKHIYHLRFSRILSLNELAAKLGYSEVYLHEIESNKRPATLRVIKRINFCFQLEFNETDGFYPPEKSALKWDALDLVGSYVAIKSILDLINKEALQNHNCNPSQLEEMANAYKKVNGSGYTNAELILHTAGKIHFSFPKAEYIQSHEKK